MNLDRPAILGIVFGALIGGATAALQIYELRRRNRRVQPKGVNVLIPGAVGRLLFVVWRGGWHSDSRMPANTG